MEIVKCNIQHQVVRMIRYDITTYLHVVAFLCPIILYMRENRIAL